MDFFRHTQYTDTHKNMVELRDAEHFGHYTYKYIQRGLTSDNSFLL